MAKKFFNKNKTVTLYQVKCDDDAVLSRSFFNSMMGRYVPVSEMEPVAAVIIKENKAIEEILDECFGRFNARTRNDGLNYSMSAGDVLDVDGVKYRCCMAGWKQI